MNLKPKSHQSSTTQGFTLVESLVAITILIIGVLGPMMAATRGITDGLYAQNQLIATYLAQEALELASIQLKNNDVNNSNFLAELTDCLSVSCAVVIDPDNDVSFKFKPCSNPDVNSCEMAYDNNDVEKKRFYKYDNGTNFVGPVFKRTLAVMDLETNKQVLLEAKVTWVNKQGTAEKNVTLYRYAYNPK